MSRYFSEREFGDPAGNIQEIGEPFWRAWAGLIRSYSERNYFTEKFPESCFESPYPVQCDQQSLSSLFRAEIEGVSWPLVAGAIPETHFILDSIEFFARIVSKPTQIRYHSYGQHDHILAFDQESGLLEYHEAVNRLFRRCKHPYELQLDASGRVERILPAGLDELVKTRYRTGDSTLDQLLTVAVTKIQDKDPAVRAEALEKLWDAWERLKTILNPDKKQGINQLLQRAFPEPQLCGQVNDEANALTRIGNDFMIRHSETTKVAIASEHVDYLFHRLLALVQALIRVL
ncbi:MAG: hypothetical protein HYZ50_14440 [Deltaproteobacteria bacterium]|nr:hypothetical protein [Deltaproteobacteria bacterium]